MKPLDFQKPKKHDWQDGGNVVAVAQSPIFDIYIIHYKAGTSAENYGARSMLLSEIIYCRGMKTYQEAAERIEEMYQKYFEKWQ